jgi:hypothetical protein
MGQRGSAQLEPKRTGLATSGDRWTQSAAVPQVLGDRLAERCFQCWKWSPLLFELIRPRDGLPRLADSLSACRVTWTDSHWDRQERSTCCGQTWFFRVLVANPKSLTWSLREERNRNELDSIRRHTLYTLPSSSCQSMLHEGPPCYSTPRAKELSVRVVKRPCNLKQR